MSPRGTLCAKCTDEGRRGSRATILTGPMPLCRMCYMLAHPGECGQGCGQPIHSGTCRVEHKLGAAKKRPEYCLPCGEKRIATEAVTEIDGDPMCDLCARADRAASAWHEEKAVKVVEAKSSPTPSLMDKPAPHEKRTLAPSIRARKKYMDTLVANEISIDAIPAAPKKMKKPVGRIGQLWMRFYALTPGRALTVECRDDIHVGTTDRAIAGKAKRMGIGIESRRVGSTLYLWKVQA